MQSVIQHSTQPQESQIVVKSFLELYIKCLLTTLGISHPQGYGKLQKISCQVKFEYIVPLDINKTPFVIFLSKGIHTHQPPPPIKTPIEILTGVIQVIKRLATPTMTGCMLS